MLGNNIKRVAIVGAGGQSGSFIATALIKTNQFHITAITRPDSTNTMPSGLNAVVKASYDDKPSLVSALTGQDCLIITMSVFAGPEASQKLIEAAAEANVPWILPNEWGISGTDPVVAKETMLGDTIRANRDLITNLGRSSYIAVVCSFWYEYSLTAGPWAYGFDWDNKQVTFYDRGDTWLSTTTWPKVAAAVASLLSLPVHRETDVDGPCLDDFKNEICYVSSFRVTQRKMLDSILRVTGARESDWTVEYQDVKQRYADGQKELGEGKREGFGKMLYSRLFYPDAPGDYAGKGLSHNELLGLGEEELDERTKIAIEMWEKKSQQ